MIRQFLSTLLLFSLIGCSPVEEQNYPKGVMFNYLNDRYESCVVGGAKFECTNITRAAYEAGLEQLGNILATEVLSLNPCSVFFSNTTTILCTDNTSFNRRQKIGREIYVSGEKIVVSIEGNYPWQDIEQIFRPNPFSLCEPLYIHHYMLSNFEEYKKFNTKSKAYTQRLCPLQ